MRRARGFLAAFAPAALVLVGACSPPVPANPTYTKDVQPILAAHCVRCHGANGMLNSMNDVPGAIKAPRICYFQRYEDQGDCSTASSPTCQRGAGYCASMFPAYIDAADDSGLRMPPPPAERVNEWEHDVLFRWAAVMPPAQ